MRAPRCWSIAIAASSLLGACGSVGPDGTAIEAVAEFADTIMITTSTRLDVDGINGVVNVSGTMPAGMVIVSGLRRVRSDNEADARDRLNDILVSIGEIGNVINVTTEHLEDPDGRTFEVDYDIFVPPPFEVDVEYVNGGVNVDELGAPTILSTVNGEVTATNVSGDLRVIVTNGGIDADIVVRAGGVIDLRTVNGELSLDIPTITSSTFEATVVNGSIQITNLLLNDQTITSSRVTGRLGSGDGMIMLVVTNGGIDATGR